MKFFSDFMLLSAFIKKKKSYAVPGHRKNSKDIAVIISYYSYCISSWTYNFNM